MPVFVTGPPRSTHLIMPVHPAKLIVMLIVMVHSGLAMAQGRGSFLKKSSSTTEQVENRGEFIIVSGGPALRKWENLREENEQHDRWWGNFIRAARARIQQLQQQHGAGYPITWLVYRPGYVTRSEEDGQPLISWIESVRDKYKINLVWLETGRDIIRHINSGKDRKRVKIVGFEYYGHSNQYAFMMDYSNDILGASTSWLHEKDLQDIQPSAFSGKAKCRSYGCKTGESMSAKWRAATGVRMWGAKGKTDYSNPLKPTLSPGGYWKR
jgi:hypothetical protein